jgi:hypothetical protein
MRLAQQQERESYPREKDEQTCGEPEDGDRKKARRHEKSAIDHATAPQNARYVDREAGSVAGTLPVVSFHLASQVAKNQGTWGDHQESEKAEPVSNASTDDRTGDEV